jgi:hypothetical protein
MTFMWIERKGMEMLKKILVGALLVAMVSLLVFGFVRAFGTSAEAHGGSANLTSVARGQGGRRTGSGNEEYAPNAQGGGYGRGQGQGLGAGTGDRAPNTQGGGYGRGQGQGLGQGQGPGTETGDRAPNTQGGGYGNGQGQGHGQGQGGQGSSRQEPQAEITSWQTVEGIVVETDELVIQLDSGKTLQIGLGPSHYRESQGFALSAGERVQVDGYIEDGEFKAAQVTKLDSGESIVLRDPSGRPMWAGQGRRSGSTTL